MAGKIFCKNWDKKDTRDDMQQNLEDYYGFLPGWACIDQIFALTDKCKNGNKIAKKIIGGKTRKYSSRNM